MSATDVNLPAELRDLHDQRDAAERDARALVAGLTEAQGTWQPQPGAWSIAECLDHLATANRVDVRAMREPAERARARGRLRHRPVRPGWVGRLFVRTLEPPPARWAPMKAPRSIRPRASPPLAGVAGPPPAGARALGISSAARRQLGGAPPPSSHAPLVMRNKPSIAVPDEARKQAVAALRAYLDEHLDEEVGELKASLLLDFILAELGPTIYNQAIADARAFFEERVGDLAAVCYREEFPSAGRRKR